MRGATAALTLISLWAPVASAAQDLALTRGIFLNPADESVQRGTLVIRDGRVAGLEDGVPEGFTGDVVDLDGAYVIPALADVHTHSFGNGSPTGTPQMLGPQGTANAALFNGVGYVLDLFSPEEMIFGFRDEQRAAGPGGAELFAAGPCLTATDGHCSEYGVPTRIVDTPEDARREVADLARSAPDVVKIVYDNETYGGRQMPTVDLATLTAVLEAAREHGLPTVVHVGTWDDVRDAAVAGATAVTHTPGPDPVPDGLPRLLVEAGTFHIPTLAVQGDFARFVERPELLEDELLVATVPEDLRATYRLEGDVPPRIEGWIAWQRTLVESNLASVGELAAAGVPMLTGTDGGNFAVFQGYSVHRELALLVEAGLDPWSALRAATTHASRFLGRSWGVEVGDEATLVVLEGSPLEAIEATRRIRSVIQRGVVVDRASLRTW